MKDWDRLADQKIAQAEEEGRFRDLPGLGRPIPGVDEGWDETRWLREKLRAEDLRVMPPAWALRQWAREETDRLSAVDDPGELRLRVEAFNAELRERMRRVLWGPPADVAPIDVEAYLAARDASSDSDVVDPEAA